MELTNEQLLYARQTALSLSIDGCHSIKSPERQIERAVQYLEFLTGNKIDNIQGKGVK